MQRDHVHIAFDHDQLALLEGRLPCAGEVVDHRAFVEEPRLRRVEIFGLRVGIEGARAESDDAGFHVEDGNGQPVAEAIVRRPPIVGPDDEPSVQKLGLGETLFNERVLQSVARAWRIADTKLFQSFARQPAPFRVSQCLAARWPAQRLLEQLSRRLQRIDEP